MHDEVEGAASGVRTPTRASFTQHNQSIVSQAPAPAEAQLHGLLTSTARHNSRGSREREELRRACALSVRGMTYGASQSRSGIHYKMA